MQLRLPACDVVSETPALKGKPALAVAGSAATFLGARRAFGKELLHRARFAGEEFLVALPDRCANLRVADFLFVLQFVG
jgi:hypothetical protein